MNEVKENKPNKKLIYIIIVIALILFAFGAGFWLGKSQQQEAIDNAKTGLGQENTKEEEKEDPYDKKYYFDTFDTEKVTKVADTTSELSKNIEIYGIYFIPKSGSYGKTRQVYVYGKNNNSQMVNAKVTFEYYDKEGYRIEKQTGYDEVYGNSEFVLYTYVIDDSYEYSSVKMTYEANKTKSYYTEVPVKQLDITVNKINNGTINMLVKNNYAGNENPDAAIYTHTACVYYKGGKIVYAQNSTISDLRKGTTGESKFYDSSLSLSNDFGNDQKIEYDDYKAFVYSSYYSDNTNY